MPRRSPAVLPNCPSVRAGRRPPATPLLAILIACDVLGPAAPLPDGAIAFLPPAEYRTWWARTEDCSGVTGDFDQVRWYLVPDVSVFATVAGPEVGRWSRGGNGTEIVLAGAYRDDEMVVRHEMLHALLDQSGHPPAYFVNRCHLTWESWGGG